MLSFSPTSIALIGASEEEHKLGNIIFRNLLGSGFRGSVFPINPKHQTIAGTRCYPSITDIESPVDLAIIATPAASVTALAEECGRKGVPLLVIISAGFGETGTDEGHAREEALRQISATYGMRIIGPNCLGLLRPSIGLNASFAATPETAGSIGLISQSGAMAVALLDGAASRGLGFSTVVSIGNAIDVDECAVLEALGEDEETTVIGVYLERVQDGARFMEIAARIGAHTPIVLIKAGASARGAQAVASHTGSLAGSQTALIAACERAGIRLATSTEHFLELLTVLHISPPLISRGVAIITNAGGPGVLATDAAEHAGLELTSLSPRTEASLRQALPQAASTLNPIDLLGDAREDRYASAIEACATDRSIDGLAVILTPQVMTPCEGVAREILACRTRHPALPIVAAFMGGGAVQTARAALRAGGVPVADTPEAAVRMLAGLRTPPRRRAMPLNDTDDDIASAATGLLRSRTGLLSEDITAELLSLYGIPIPEQSLARSAREATEAAAAIGFPVIAKISSPDILHKTDLGCVRANLRTKRAVSEAYQDIVTNAERGAPAAAVRGVLIQRFLPIGHEFIIGGIRDPQYGPLVMVGLGGIYAELLHDTCFRIAPVDSAEAYDMLTRLQSWRLLQGMRGDAPLAIDALAEVVRSISLLLRDCSGIREIDLNPVLVGEKSLVVADAKVVMG